MLPLLFILAAHAAEGDTTLSLTLTGPTGEAAIQEQVSIPHEQTYPLQYGKALYEIEVSATPDGKRVALVATIYELKGRKRLPVSAPKLVLNPEDQRTKEVTTPAPRGYAAPDGAKPTLLTWSLEGSWQWTGPDWPADARAASVAPGQVVTTWTDTWLYAAPDTGASKVHLRPEEHAPGAHAYLALEVLEDKGAWLRVKGLDGQGRCHAAQDSALGALGVEAWVERSALLLMVKEPVEVPFEDGRSATLQPGAVALPPEGRREVFANELLFTVDTGGAVAALPLPAGSLGLGVSPGAPRALATAETHVVPSSSGTIGNTPVGPVTWLSARQAYVMERFEGAGQDQAGVALAERCGDWRLSVQAARIKPAGAFEAVPDSAPSVGTPGPWSLTWPGGEPAGQADALPLSPPAPDADGARCALYSIDTTPVPVMEGVVYEVDPERSFKACLEAKD
ncbi:MAG: hypothetical protein H6739_17390 [Alphaproteobacteria bacterium]|nr:hypothetical protein [Alphaproteobacteria bacterium]